MKSIEGKLNDVEAMETGNTGTPDGEDNDLTTARDNTEDEQNVEATKLITDETEQATEEEKEIINRIVVLMNRQDDQNCNLKKVDRIKVLEETRRVDKALQYIKTNNVTEINRLLTGVGSYVEERLGIKSKTRERKSGGPWWKRRIERDIKTLNKGIGVLERKNRGELRREGKHQMLERKYNIKCKGLAVVMEELKQRTLAKKAKVKRYEQRINSIGKIECLIWIKRSFIKNWMVRVDRRRLYLMLKKARRFRVVHATM